MKKQDFELGETWPHGSYAVPTATGVPRVPYDTHHEEQGFTQAKKVKGGPRGPSSTSRQAEPGRKMGGTSPSFSFRASQPGSTRRCQGRPHKTMHGVSRGEGRSGEVHPRAQGSVRTPHRSESEHRSPYPLRRKRPRHEKESPLLRWA